MSQSNIPRGGQSAPEPKKSHGCIKAAVVLLALAILCVGGCVFLRGIFHSRAKHAAEPAGATPPPVAATPAPGPIALSAPSKPPSYEEWFIGSCKQYETGVPQGDESRIAYLRGERSRGISNALPGVRTLSQWTGTLRKAQTTVGGKLAIAIELPNSNILLQTWGDPVSDATAGTLIDQKSELYRHLLSLAIGTPVSFEGEFLADKDDWVKEGSKTAREGLISPKFIVRFKDVRSPGK